MGSLPKRIPAILCGGLLAAGLMLATRLPAEPKPAGRPGDPLVLDSSSSDPRHETELVEWFEKRIRPILARRCFECHGPELDEPKGGLRLDTRAGVLAGGDTGPAIVPGKPDESPLVDAINYRGDYEMPPKSKLPEEEIGLLTEWVARGAPWPAESSAAVQARRTFDLTQRKDEHWCWRGPARHDPPPVLNESWSSMPIDRFILARLEAEGLAPADPADRSTLIRRAYFAIIGLPPTAVEVREFVEDSSPDAWERLIDRLLASPQFGERWARHWLDLVRYAETRGHEFDYALPNAHEYRDYVIRALNADVPYERFVVEHIAGDLLPAPRVHPRHGFNESVLGTGFWYLGEMVHSPVDIRKDETDRLDNAIDVFGKTFLGLTVSCARCHDHKFDAISQRDYTALVGFLQSSTYRQIAFETIEHNRGVAGRLWAVDEEHRRRLAHLAGEALRPGVAQASAYLLAAREALLAAQRAADQDSAGGDDKEALHRIAAERGLDGARLSHWTAALRAAAQTPDDPLHFWLQTQPTAGGMIDSGGRRLATPRSALPDGARVIVDFAEPGPEDFLPDAFSFGPAPMSAGTLRVADDDPRTLRVQRLSAARFDPALGGMRLADGTENDNGGLGGWVRTGRTLRTRAFTLDSGMLWYLVRGPVDIYAAVDSYTMFHGPLHGSLIKRVADQPRDRLRWIGHDLRAYRGHRLHVQFSPHDQEFELLLVVESDRPPPNPETRWLAQAQHSPEAAGKAGAVGDPDDVLHGRVAAQFQEQLAGAVELLAADRLAAADDPPTAAALTDWLLTRLDLFVDAESDARSRLAAAVEEYAAARQAVAAELKKESRTAPAIWDGSGEDEHFLIRGNPGTPQERVPRRFLEALAGTEPIAAERGSGRLELARHVVDPQNPLTYRVFVNRVWHHLLGRGIVGSTDNFGVLGETPTHPELLDYLALSFVDEHGGSLKSLIRAVMLTSTYQMSSRAADPRAEQVDPQNRLLHRMPVRRLEAEAIRDAMLTVSGRLDRGMHGRSVPIHLTPFQEGRGRPGSGPLDGNGRRSIYLAVRRNFLSSMMLAFDAPIPFSTVGRRATSNVPAQALILMNDPFVVGQAEVWARRTLSDTAQGQPADRSADPPLDAIDRARHRITSMYVSAFARGPSEDELAAALAFLRAQGAAHGLSAPRLFEDVRPWTDLAHVLLNVKEFIFLP